MALPLKPPVLPQLARPAKVLPTGEGWAYEPKWDGFRALAFIDGDHVHLQSRSGKDLGRYFPELRFGTGRAVLDGELVILDERGLPDFETLQQRIHPAASRIERLAGETPARFVVFDVLARGDDLLLDRPFAERRSFLPEVTEGSVVPTPFVTAVEEAEPWLHGAEGVIAKRLDAPYRPGERTGMVKVKRVRTIDCVVIGWRIGKEPGTAGSLILGLHDEQGRLQVVGHTSGFSIAERRALPARLAPYETGERGAGEPSRWSSDRDLEWTGLRPELVVEITFDHVSGGRIRHGTKLLRWRDDKAPQNCTTAQLST